MFEDKASKIDINLVIKWSLDVGLVEKVKSGYQWVD